MFSKRCALASRSSNVLQLIMIPAENSGSILSNLTYIHSLDLSSLPNAKASLSATPTVSCYRTAFKVKHVYCDFVV